MFSDISLKTVRKKLNIYNGRIHQRQNYPKTKQSLSDHNTLQGVWENHTTATVVMLSFECLDLIFHHQKIKDLHIEGFQLATPRLVKLAYNGEQTRDLQEIIVRRPIIHAT